MVLLTPTAKLRGLMQCYFNLVSAHQVIPDDEGVEVGDLNRARTLALEVVAEMLQDGEAQIADWRGWQLEATSGSGAVLFILCLDALLS